MNTTRYTSSCFDHRRRDRVPVIPGNEVVGLMQTRSTRDGFGQGLAAPAESQARHVLAIHEVDELVYYAQTHR